MTGEDELSDEDVEAARTILAILLTEDENDPARFEMVSMVRELRARDEVLPLTGALVIVHALLELIESEMGLDRRDVLSRLARFLAS